MKNLAIIILNQKINEKIAFINEQSIRKFDKKIDYISVCLTPRQFEVIKRHFNLKQTYVLFSGYMIDNFSFEDWKIKPRYNDRLNVYELFCKSNEYIEDFEQRQDYIDKTL